MTVMSAGRRRAEPPDSPNTHTAAMPAFLRRSAGTPEPPFAAPPPRCAVSMPAARTPPIPRIARQPPPESAGSPLAAAAAAPAAKNLIAKWCGGAKPAMNTPKIDPARPPDRERPFQDAQNGLVLIFSKPPRRPAIPFLSEDDQNQSTHGDEHLDLLDVLEFTGAQNPTPAQKQGRPCLQRNRWTEASGPWTVDCGLCTVHFAHCTVHFAMCNVRAHLTRRCAVHDFRTPAAAGKPRHYRKLRTTNVYTRCAPSPGTLAPIAGAEERRRPPCGGRRGKDREKRRLDVELPAFAVRLVDELVRFVHVRHAHRVAVPLQTPAEAERDVAEEDG